jgi:hypothetical protein
MAKKDSVFGYKLTTAQSLSASFNSAVFRVKYLDNIGINIDCTGVTSNTGTFAIQHRIVKEALPSESTFKSSWATLTLDAVPTLAGASTVFFVNLNQVPPGEIRVAFTAAGGSPNGSCDIWLSATSLGG